MTDLSDVANVAAVDPSGLKSEVLDEPTLGATVIISELSCGAAMDTMAASSENGWNLSLAVFCACAVIDGKRIGYDELRESGARKLGAYLRAGLRAVQLNGMADVTPGEGEKKA